MALPFSIFVILKTLEYFSDFPSQKLMVSHHYRFEVIVFGFELGCLLICFFHEIICSMRTGTVMFFS